MGPRRVQGCSSVDVLGELRYSSDQVRCSQVPNPLGCLCTFPMTNVNLDMRETNTIVVGHRALAIDIEEAEETVKSAGSGGCGARCKVLLVRGFGLEDEV